VVADIERLVLSGCYERVNMLMSLFQAPRLRRLAAERARGSVVADLGAGPGYTALEDCRASRGLVILVDASPAMLSIATAMLESECTGMHVEVAGLFEALPLPDCSVDAVTATFSLRDAIDREAAVREAARILKPHGRLVVVDLYRPRGRLALALARLYFTIIPVLGAVIAGCPRQARSYLGLQSTLPRMETLEGMKALLSRYFRRVEAIKPLPSTGVWVAEEPLVGCGHPGREGLLEEGRDGSSATR